MFEIVAVGAMAMGWSCACRSCGTASRRVSQSRRATSGRRSTPSAGLAEQRDESIGRMPLRPQRAVEARVAAALGREVDRRRDGVEADRLHALVGESTASSEAYGDAQRVQRVLEAHQPEPDRAVAQVGAARLRDGVEVDVDRRCRASASPCSRCAPACVSRPPSRDVRGQVDRAEVAHRHLIVRRVQGDLGAQVRGMHDADMLLRRAQVARVLEGDPRMARSRTAWSASAATARRRAPAGTLDLAARGRAS